ncbi:N-acetylmuramidase family protein [Psychrobacter sp. T6-1]|uniref:N-acetylmuramidase family protein n=1 Tax=Psychrobacter sp. T6-1 TaxID=3457447 RepID=UPI003FD09309
MSDNPSDSTVDTNIVAERTAFFDWLRDQQDDKSLTQDNVDAAHVMLLKFRTDELKELLMRIGLATPSILLIPNPNPPKVTRDDINAAAKRIDVPAAQIKAINDVESPKGGFYSDGRPKILFERHKFWQALTDRNWITKRNEMYLKYPDICNPNPGDYNARPQYEKLEIAATLNWDAAHEACSWGFGQVMGFNYESLGYESVRDFVEQMYKSEGAQLDAVCRYIQVNHLDDDLRRKDWAGFAKGYNGRDYQRNKYDTKMAAAFAKAIREGW